MHDKLNSGVQVRSREKAEADLAATGKGGKPASDLNRFFGPQVEIEASPARRATSTAKPPGSDGFPRNRSRSRGLPLPHEKRRVELVPRRRQGSPHPDLHQRTTRRRPHPRGIYKTHPKGHIGLQVHGIKKGDGPYDVAWRNLRIRPLK